MLGVRIFGSSPQRYENYPRTRPLCSHYSGGQNVKERLGMPPCPVCGPGGRMVWNVIETVYHWSGVFPTLYIYRLRWSHQQRLLHRYMGKLIHLHVRYNRQHVRYNRQNCDRHFHLCGRGLLNYWRLSQSELLMPYFQSNLCHCLWPEQTYLKDHIHTHKQQHYLW